MELSGISDKNMSKVTEVLRENNTWNLLSTIRDFCEIRREIRYIPENSVMFSVLSGNYTTHTIELRIFHDSKGSRAKYLLRRLGIDNLLFEE